MSDKPSTLLSDYQWLLERLRLPRSDRGAESRYMTHANGYVMARRPGRTPYVMTEKEWLAIPVFESAKEGGKP